MRLILWVMLSLASACSLRSLAPELAGSGNLQVVSRVLPPFHAVHSNGEFVVNVEVGDRPPPCEIRGDDNLVQHVRTTVTDGVLTIDTDQRLAPSETLTVTLHAPKFDAAHMSGAGKLQVLGLHGAQFDLKLSGAASVDLSGEVSRATLAISGAGTVHADKLVAQEVSIDLSGAASAHVFATQKLHAAISGAGSVKYGGKPKAVTQQISGVGSLTAEP